MDITIQPGLLHGTVAAIPSKSQAHRLLICAAFADAPTKLFCPDTNQDIEATAECLRALGAEIQRTATGYLVTPHNKIPASAVLNCHESGSTLRFLLPIVGALGVDGTFLMTGRLPQRPLSPLWEEMERMGCILTRPSENSIRCHGKLHSGEYSISGSVSSQFITGLLYAMSLLDKDRHLRITGKIESRPYIEMTQAAMELFGVDSHSLRFSDKQCYHSPGSLRVEGDWSNAAFFLTANTLGSEIVVNNLASDSSQGDRVIAEILPSLDSHCVIDAADIPDLVPILAVAAGAKQGAAFTNIQRLRLKESDRVASIIALLKAIGGKAEATEDTLLVYATEYQGGTVDTAGDHRIAMAAAIAATICKSPVTIVGSQCVRKSYPGFWDDYRRLGGKI